MASTEQTKKGTSLIASIIGVFVVALMVVYSLLTGADPLEVFGETQVTPPIEAVLPTPIPPTPTPFPTPDPNIDLLGPDTSAWWQVFFTSPNTISNPEVLDGSIPEVLIAYIHNAQTSIHIAAFEFNLTPVAEALIAAHQRGVDVRWVTDDEYGLEADEFAGEKLHTSAKCGRKAGAAVHAGSPSGGCPIPCKNEDSLPV